MISMSINHKKETYRPIIGIRCPENLENTPSQSDFTPFAIEQRIAIPLCTRIPYPQVLGYNERDKWDIFWYVILFHIIIVISIILVA